MKRSLILSLAIALSLVMGVGIELHAQDVSERAECDPVVSALASVAIPGWGQQLNGEPQRKSLVHFAIGLGTTLAMIYRWVHDDGRIFRTARILWSFWSGMEAYGSCAFKISR